ncbi:hypothetical protein, partial [Comamonas sp.]|uniref:hypothetical protein n=1 Tax=Comamonas sp. TaxID=34028 RepID=UPI0026490908
MPQTICYQAQEAMLFDDQNQYINDSNTHRYTLPPNDSRISRHAPERFFAPLGLFESAWPCRLRQQSPQPR